MYLKHLASIVDSNGAARATLYLQLGAELEDSRRRALPSAQLPSVNRRFKTSHFSARQTRPAVG